MEHCKSEDEVRSWAKVNGYSVSDISLLISKWKSLQQKTSTVKGTPYLYEDKTG